VKLFYEISCLPQKDKLYFNSMAIFCIGDIHGKFNELAERIRQIPPNSHILCVGDIGLGFEDSNHPSCLFYANDVAAEMNTCLMADVDSLELEGQNIIFVGGAISVDRSHEGRINGYSWWKEEPVHDSSASRVYQIVEEFGPADLLITHAGPITTLPVLDEFDPNIYHYTQDDPFLLHDINIERTRLSDCVQYSRAPMVVYGHYHIPLSYENTGVKYRCVAELELWEFIPNSGAHLPSVGITEEEKAKVETAPIKLKATLTSKVNVNTSAISTAQTNDATTDELVKKTQLLKLTSSINLKATSAHQLRVNDSDNNELPPTPMNPEKRQDGDTQ